MSLPTCFPPKFPSETPITAIDFGPRIAANSPTATIVSCSFGVELFTSDPLGDGDLSALGSPFVQGTLVVQQIQGGIEGTRYVLTYTATLSTGEVWQEQRSLHVKTFM